MQLKLQNLQKLISLSRKFLDKNKNLIDIIVIRSALRGKLKPEDVDLVLLTRCLDPELPRKFIHYTSVVRRLNIKIHPVEFPADKFFQVQSH